jgi:uncharacterized protein DUF2059/uncharacterized protein DUF4124
MKSVIALIVLVGLVVPAHAGDVYRWVEGSTVVYSDQPPQEGAVVTAMPGREPLPSVTAGVATLTSRSGTESVSTQPSTVDEILDLSGARTQLVGLAGSLGAGYLPHPGQLEARDGARVARIIAQHFAPERLYVAIHDEFDQQVDRERLDAMAAWFRSPLGRRITALEIAASKPEAAAAIAAFTAGVKTSPPTPERLELVERLDWVTGTSGVATDAALSIMGSVARAAATTAPAERRMRAGVVERRVDDMRGQMAALFGASVVPHMLYVYGPLTDAELKEYVDFLASPAGRVYNRVSHVALLRAVRGAADRTALEIVRAVPPQRWAAAAQRTSGPPAP